MDGLVTTTLKPASSLPNLLTARQLQLLPLSSRRADCRCWCCCGGVVVVVVVWGVLLMVGVEFVGAVVSMLLLLLMLFRSNYKQTLINKLLSPFLSFSPITTLPSSLLTRDG